MFGDHHTLAIAMIAALCIGLSKAGFSGISMISVVILAELYGSKTSVGLALPLLIAADLIAYPAFIKHGSWRPVWKLLPAALLGMLFGWWLLGEINETIARRLIGICVLFMVLLQGFKAWKPGSFDSVSHSRGFGNAAGIFGGVATMLANAAGPVIQLYLLARRIPKMEMIGIGARFFLLINLIKIPLNTRLALITADSLIENLKLLPAVVIGLLIGRWLIHRVPQLLFEWMVVTFAFAAALRLLLTGS